MGLHLLSRNLEAHGSYILADGGLGKFMMLPVTHIKIYIYEQHALSDL